MHPLYLQADRLSYRVIGAAIEVHREKGPGLMESIYERCLMHELALRRIKAENQKSVPIRYKGVVFDDVLRADLIIGDCLVVEAKAVDHLLPIHKAQLLSYMKLLDYPLGLLINFNVVVVKDGISRLILPGANLP